MSKRQLQSAAVLARVKAVELRLNNAAEVMRISHRGAKRMWRRHQAGWAAARRMEVNSFQKERGQSKE